MPSHDIRVITGDAIAELRALHTDSFDSIVTDPPYELSLMGLAWDSSGIAYSVELWKECLRVLKPGGHLLAFGATRTYHRMTCAIEDAGFEIRDSIHWIYGNGMPKGADISKAIDRRRYDRAAVLQVTAFVRAARDRSGKTNAAIDAHVGVRGMASHWTSKGSQPAVPTVEQWRMLKGFLGFGDELDTTLAQLCERKGKAGEAWERRAITGYHRKPAPPTLWRAPLDPAKNAGPARERRDEPATDAARQWLGWGTTLKPAHEPIVVARKPPVSSVANNVLQFRTGALNLDACRIPATAAAVGGEGRIPTNVILDEGAACELDQQAGRRKSGIRRAGVARANRGGYAGPDAVPSAACYGEEGGVSRFFYVARASAAERRAGLTDEAPRHPTMKPVTLMRYLVRLVTPTAGIVLDPFTGSGTTGIAAVLEGASFVGIERNPEYIAVAAARIKHWKGEASERVAA